MITEQIPQNLSEFLPTPSFYDPDKVSQVWKVPYQERADAALKWAKQYEIAPASSDKFKIAVVIVDAQNTFCLPEFELFVAGRSGMGAIEDNQRLCEFIYHNLKNITQISVTMDTHTAIQIFHSLFLVDENGEHPPPLTLVSHDDIKQGKWKFNPAIASSVGLSSDEGQEHLHYYTHTLGRSEKYDLTIWPYHAMLGGIGHALVSSVEEAVFFHTIARKTQADFIFKGQLATTENYSAIGPEVLENAKGEMIAEKNKQIIQKAIDFDALVIAGEAKSHCVAWTIDDLLDQIQVRDTRLAQKIYLLEDCTSSVVIPGIVDYSDEANEAFRRFAEEGMHIVQSTQPISSWPGIYS